jgi:thiamine-monophosphate kinase
MKVSEIGEFKLIDLIRRVTSRRQEGCRASGLVLGIGDDAAVISRPRGLLLATTDTLVEGVHFTPGGGNWRALGWKSLAVNLSDIAAMGGTPLHALVSLSLSPRQQVGEILEFYRGFMGLGNREGVAVAGGNLTRAPKLVITVTLLGETGNGGKYLTRSGARPGDVVAVTGWPGLSAAALKGNPGKFDERRRSLSLFERAHFKPEPRLAEGRQIKHLGVRAAIDISDGLIADLGHVCEESRVSAVVYTPSLPVHPKLKAVFREKALDLVMAGGEDYELLFTAPAAVVRLAAGKLRVPVTIIGEVVKRGPEPVRVLDGEGREQLPPRGWDHFPGRPARRDKPA